MIKFEELKEYIDTNNKKPSKHDNNIKNKSLSYWLINQQTNYKNKDHIMKIKDIYNKWTDFITCEKYKKYFLLNEDEWLNNLDNVKKYIDENSKRPSCIDKINVIKKWDIG